MGVEQMRWKSLMNMMEQEAEDGQDEIGSLICMRWMGWKSLINMMEQEAKDGWDEIGS